MQFLLHVKGIQLINEFALNAVFERIYGYFSTACGFVTHDRCMANVVIPCTALSLAQVQVNIFSYVQKMNVNLAYVHGNYSYFCKEVLDVAEKAHFEC